MDISVQTSNITNYERPHPWGDRPDHLPLSAAVWDKAKAPGAERSTFVIKALYEAVRELETQMAERGRD